ncbi:nucleoside deaminase [bacterium]|nr:nucleoside deaminase [bacterium]
MKKKIITAIRNMLPGCSVSAKVISNEKIDNAKVETATKIITELQSEMDGFTQKGSGPFIAAIYDADGNLVVKAANTVINDNCSNNHAEMNAIRAAEQKLGTYDLAQYKLKLYVTSEPCMMCLGGILWSGIKEVYYGVPTKSVEEITGFDEGFKPNWFEEFKKRGIIVYGNIEPKLGEQELYKYVQKGNKVY